MTGVVPTADAFSGFGHSATVIIALVLIVSRALINSGVIELLERHLVSATRSLGAHIGIMSALAAGLSAVMNNVAALAVLMSVDLQAAAKANRSPALTLMPLSFASILGGMITLIGTPPNIIIAEYRGDALGEPFRMFDFAPVGLACAMAGVLFVATLGWRLIPRDCALHDSGKELHELGEYIAELKVFEIFLRIERSASVVKGILDLWTVVEYQRQSPEFASAVSTTDCIRQIENDGRPNERRLPVGTGSGYLWRAVTLSTYVQREGGVIVEFETIGLSRRFPRMLGWIIEPIARRLGRGSAADSLRQLRRAVTGDVQEATRNGADVVSVPLPSSWCSQ